MNFMALISALSVRTCSIFLEDPVLSFATEDSISGRIDPSRLRISAGMVLFWLSENVIILYTCPGCTVFVDSREMLMWNYDRL